MRRNVDVANGIEVVQKRQDGSPIFRTISRSKLQHDVVGETAVESSSKSKPPR